MTKEKLEELIDIYQEKIARISPNFYILHITPDALRVGEANKAALEWRFGRNRDLAQYRTEMIQVAAVAVATVECLDRGTWEEK